MAITIKQSVRTRLDIVSNQNISKDLIRRVYIAKVKYKWVLVFIAEKVLGRYRSHTDHIPANIIGKDIQPIIKEISAYYGFDLIVPRSGDRGGYLLTFTGEVSEGEEI